MKRIALLTLVLVFTLALAACGGTKPTKLGTSAFSIVLPKGYTAVNEEMGEDQVAYYYKDDNSVDFDVYQWAKEGAMTLESEATYYATEYGTVALPFALDDIFGYVYISTEEYEGVSYQVINYMVEDDTYIVEICFWTNGTEDEVEFVEDIIETLKKN